jgi:hypothetical protein
MKGLLLLLVAGALLLLALSSIAGASPVLLSAQVGYWSATLVVLASFRSYRKMVRDRLSAGAIPDGGIERDVIDRQEDPYDLYGEEEGGEPPSPREAIREEKRRLKRQRRSPLQTARDAVPAFSLWRLGAYGMLILGFFFLRDRGMLHPGAYLGSLALPIVLAIWYLMVTEGRRAEKA